MLYHAVLLLLLPHQALSGTELSGVPPSDNHYLTSLELRQEWVDLREEAAEMREEAYERSRESYTTLDRAYDIRDSAHAGRAELDRTVVETLSAMRGYLTNNEANMRNIGGSLSSILERVQGLEEKQGKVERRLAAWQSEVRLISLHKQAEEEFPHGSGYDADLAVDGLLTFDRHADNSMRTYSHSLGTGPNNKLWVDFGGMFRVHRVKVWNLRHCCQERFIGTHVYIDENLIGTAIQAQSTYTFEVPESAPVYGHKLILHQPLVLQLHVLEVQVWGNGPFDADDLFA